MMLFLDAIVLAALILFGVAGLWRGPRAEAVTLAGLTLGALLADEWGDAWGGDLAAAIGPLGPGGARLVVRMLLFLVPLIGLGYLGALALPKAAPLGFRTRVAGVALGVFNGAAILAEVLRNWHYSQDATSGLAEDPVTHFFLEWTGWWPLLLVLLGLIVVGVVIARRPRRLPAPVPVKQPALSTSGSASLPAATTVTYPPTTAGSSLPGRSSGTTNGSGSSPATGGTGSTTTAAEKSPLPVRATTDPAHPATDSTRTPAKPEGPRCRTCGNALAPGAAFCPNCGTPV
jgi:hypothetical protein